GSNIVTGVAASDIALIKPGMAITNPPANFPANPVVSNVLPAVTQTGLTNRAGTTVVTNLPSLTGIVANEGITGTNVPAGATIASANTGTPAIPSTIASASKTGLTNISGTDTIGGFTTTDIAGPASATVAAAAPSGATQSAAGLVTLTTTA